MSFSYSNMLTHVIPCSYVYIINLPDPSCTNHTGLQWPHWFCATCLNSRHDSLSVSVCLSPGFNGHFPGEPGLAVVYWSKGWWRWWWQLDYWSYKSCKAPVKSSPPTNQYPVFYRPDALPVAPTNSVKALKGKYHIPWTCLPQAHLGAFQLCLYH